MMMVWRSISVWDYLTGPQTTLTDNYPSKTNPVKWMKLGCVVPAFPLGVLGDSGGVVNSLDFCPASLKSLGCFYFRCVLSSQWQTVTVNLRLLHWQL